MRVFVLLAILAAVAAFIPQRIMNSTSIKNLQIKFELFMLLSILFQELQFKRR